MSENQMWDKYGEFLISEHESLLHDLNKISDDLLKAKWYFIAAISAIVLAYKIVLEDFKHLTIFGQIPIIGEYFSSKSYFTSPHVDDNNVYLIFSICFVGNIILWLISEYTLSHGFLFRYIQGRAAVIENIFNDGKNEIKNLDNFDYARLINNPYDKKRFITLKNDLDFDTFIPDQFVPLHIASMWLMVLNSAFGCFVVYHSIVLCKTTLFANLQFGIPIFILTSVFFERKLMTYYLYKIKTHLEKSDIFIFTRKGQDYLRFPDWADLLFGLIGLCVCSYRLSSCYDSNFDTFWYRTIFLILWFLMGYYFITIIALLMQIYVYFFDGGSFDGEFIYCEDSFLKPTLEQVGEYEFLSENKREKFKLKKVSIYYVSGHWLLRTFHLMRLVI